MVQINKDIKKLKPIDTDDDLSVGYTERRQLYHNASTAWEEALRDYPAEDREPTPQEHKIGKEEKPVVKEQEPAKKYVFKAPGTPTPIRHRGTAGGDFIATVKTPRVNVAVEQAYEESAAERRELSIRAFESGASRDTVEFEFGRGGQGATDPGVYDPVDLVIDVIMGGTTFAGRAGLKMIAKGAIKEGAKQVGKSILADVGLGALSGTMMSLAVRAGAGPVVTMLSGIVGPVATSAILTMTRKGAAQFMRNIRRNNKKVYDEIDEALKNLPDSELKNALEEAVKSEAPTKMEIAAGRVESIKAKVKDAQGKIEEAKVSAGEAEVGKIKATYGDSKDGGTIEVDDTPAGRKHFKEFLSDKENVKLTQESKKPFIDRAREDAVEFLKTTPEEIKAREAKLDKSKKQRIKQHGEVFTPPELVNEILDKLPKEHFKDPNKTWLDPTVGDGVFPMEIKKRLLAEGHSEEHILKNMLFGVDIQEARVRNTIKNLYGITDDARLVAVDPKDPKFAKQVGQFKNEENIDKVFLLDGKVVKNFVVADGLKYNYDFGRTAAQIKAIEAKQVKPLEAEVTPKVDPEEVKIKAQEEVKVKAQEESDAEAAIKQLQKLTNEKQSEQLSIFDQSKVFNREKGGIHYDILGKKNEGLIRPKTENEILQEQLTRQLGAREDLEMISEVKELAKPHHINFENINTTEDAVEVMKLISELYAKDIKKARRGKISNEETAKVAETLGMSVDDLLKRRRGQAFNAEQALAARNVMVASAERLSELATLAKQNNFETKYLFAFRKHLAVHHAIQSQVQGLTAEAGRALQAFNIKAASDKIKLDQINEFVSNIPDTLSTRQIAEMLADQTSIEGVNTYVRQASKATTGDMLIEAWINGLLSGPQTHAVNALSNTLVALWMVPERLAAAGIGKFSKGAGDIKTLEAMHQAWGGIMGIKDAFKAFGKAFATGEGSDVVTKLETGAHRAITAENIRKAWVGRALPGHAGGTIDRVVDFFADWVVRMPGRLLIASDEGFKAIAYRMELNAQSYRRAVDEGLSGVDRAKRMKEIIENPQELAPDIHAAADNMKKYQTFTKSLGETGVAAQRLINSHPALRLIAPFIRTPINIMKFGLERTPFAFGSKKIRAELAAGGARRDMALAKISVGSMVMGVTSYYAAEGLITGGGPKDKDKRQLMRDKGWQPYSIKLGDKWYSYNRLEPLGVLLGLSADLTEIISNSNDEELISESIFAAVSAFSKNITSKTFLRGFSEALRALDDPDRFGEVFTKKFVASLVPATSLLSQIERVSDPDLRATYEILDHVRSRIPGLSESLPPRRNIWGEPIILEGGLGPDLMSPIYTSKEKDSPASDELLRLKMPIGMPTISQNIKGISIELEPFEYDRFLELMNTNPLNSTEEPLKKSIEDLIESEDYQEAHDDQKQMMIRAKFVEAKALARNLLYDEKRALRNAIEDERDRLYQERNQ